MSFLMVGQYAAAVITALIGVVALFWPSAVEGFTGLQPVGGRGVTEIRAVLGALFIGLGAAPLLLREPAAFKVLGISYLIVGAVRLVSMFVDDSVVSSNVISVIFELVFGVLLIL